MTDRGQQIESFYWMLMGLLGIAFGYLMMIGGGLFALSFLVEKLRTGVVTIGGAQYADGLSAARLVGVPALIGLAGWALARTISRRRQAAAKGES